MNRKFIKAESGTIESVAELLESGAVGVIPTDTVYGLAAHPKLPKAVERLYSIKARDSRKPIALLACDIESIERFGFALRGKARTLAEAFWPGGLTLVIENDLGRSEGFRIPDHAWTRALIKKCGGLLRVTSANISGGKDSTLAEEALGQIGLSADFIVDGGASKEGLASTVVKVSPTGEITVLREGGLDLKTLPSAANNKT